MQGALVQKRSILHKSDKQCIGQVDLQEFTRQYSGHHYTEVIDSHLYYPLQQWFTSDS